MSDEYTDDDSESLLEDEAKIDSDDLVIRRFVSALQVRLTQVTTATASATNLQAIAAALAQLTQEETQIATFNEERSRRVELAGKRRTEARADFRRSLQSLDSSLVNVAQGRRFAVHEAVTAHAKASIKVQEAQDARDAADLQLKKAESDKETWEKELAEANGLVKHKSLATEAGDKDVSERAAARALVHYKNAQAQHRTEVAAAQSDYATRLRTLRDGQSKRLGAALSGDTAKALGA